MPASYQVTVRHRAQHDIWWRSDAVNEGNLPQLQTATTEAFPKDQWMHTLSRINRP